MVILSIIKKKKHNQGTYSGNKMSPNIPNTNRENISETGVKEKWNSHSSEVKRKKCMEVRSDEFSLTGKIMARSSEVGGDKNV